MAVIIVLPKTEKAIEAGGDVETLQSDRSYLRITAIDVGRDKTAMKVKTLDTQEP